MITSIKGTPLYMAPELVKEHPYNKKADLWSLGCIIYELIVGQPPFYASNYPTLVSKITKESIKYPSYISAELKDFLKTLLRKNPKERPDWPAICDHPFVRENREELEARLDREKQYVNWIKKIKRENIFVLNESTMFKNKIYGKKELVDADLLSFDAQPTPTASPSSKKSTDTNTAFWQKTEQMSQREEGIIELRRDYGLCDKIVQTFSALVGQNSMEDHKTLNLVCKTIFNMLHKVKKGTGRGEIEGRIEILNYAFRVFRLSLTEKVLELTGETIKIIGLFAKNFCYTFSGIDISFCSNYLKYHSVLLEREYPTHLKVNFIKTSSIIVAAANVNPKKSVLFYKSVKELKFVSQLFEIIRHKEKQPLILVRSSLEWISLLLNPSNGEINQFPIIRRISYQSAFLSRL